MSTHTQFGAVREPLPDQTGRTVLITGANSGLGLNASAALASAGAQVLMACRDQARGQAAVTAVAAVAGGPPPELISLDLADLASVRACAGEAAARSAAIDTLLLNGGVMAMPRSRTVDGFELHFGTNHLGHFALAGQLISQLTASAAPRVVVTSSVMHRAGRIRWDDPNWTGRFYSAELAYGQSKLANLLFVHELAARARRAGSPLVALAAHPGAALTNLATQNQNKLVRLAYDTARTLITQSAQGGTRPLLYAATTAEPEPDGYWGPAGFLELKGSPAAARRSRASRDDASARRLWALSERLTGVTWPDPLPARP
ncbi:oxidoreductase [Mycolicibacterium moriokaense]|uniref:oxidoreductase n=1 Tax=Mycolicibacterium moriokaense TaxID=39691 RepID=UPI001F2A664A|nr:oxidoreductase [Mycolicibacterium moriokaense]